MTQISTAREELHQIIDELELDEALELLDYLHLHLESDEMTPEEEAAAAEGLAQIERGEFITGEQVRLKYGL